MQSLGIVREGGTGNYLGFPECFIGSKVEMLAYIKEKMKSRISGWFARTLSMGGKDVLLKSVALAMLIYAHVIFQTPKVHVLFPLQCNGRLLVALRRRQSGKTNY